MIRLMEQMMKYPFRCLVTLFMCIFAQSSEAEIYELAVGEGMYLYTPSPTAADYPWKAIAVATWDSSEAPDMGFSSPPDDFSAHVGVRRAFSGIQKIKVTYCWVRVNERGARVASSPMTKTWSFRCKGGGGTTTGELYIIPEELELKVGEKYNMQAWGVGLGSNSDTWKSSNTNVATVSRNAYLDATVTAKNEGQCNISVTVGGLTATCKLTVKQKGVEINETNFPDENFRKYLLGIFYGMDGILTDDEIEIVDALHIINIFSDKKIKNLKGIEYFTALEELYCQGNELTTLDVSKNTALKILACHSNLLTSLNVSKNTALEYLGCADNQLTSIDVSKCTALIEFDCTDNQFTSIDVSKNTKLTGLYCYNNQLTSLDLSKNTALDTLECYKNKLTTLDVSKNNALELLKAHPYFSVAGPCDRHSHTCQRKFLSGWK